QLAPPALFKLLERGDVDAMINISSFTVQAAAQPDKFRSIFSVNDYWRQRTGYPVIWAAPLVAWKSWVDDNPARATKYAAADRRLQKMAGGEANLPRSVGPEGCRRRMAIPGDGPSSRRLAGGA